MMIIIDDDIRISEKIKNALADYHIKNVCSYTSTKECSDEIIAKADLIFLDIEMPEENGLQFAKKIRVKDPNKKIIFISGHDEYVFDSFMVQPFFFIRKSNFLQDFKRAMDFYKTDYIRNKKHLVIKYDDKIKKLEFQSIIFIEKYKDKVLLHLINDQTIELNKPLRDIIAGLNDNFILINRGIVINLLHLVKIEGIQAVMSNDEKLEISRRKRNIVTEALYRYVREVANV